MQTEIDFTKLCKGDYIPPEQCERMFGVTRDTSEYGLKMLNLIEQVTKDLRESGKLCHVKQSDYGLYVLTDDETPGWAIQEFEGARRRINRAHVVNQEAKVSAMTDEGRKKHEAALSLGAAYQQALAAARRREKQKYSQ